MAIAIYFIIVIEFCERLCYYTFQGTQKAWLQDQGYGNAQSSSLNQIFGLLSFISCFIGGWIAETSVGRYKAIAGFVVVYVTGCFIASFAASPNVENVPMYFVGTFFLIALGTGGIKPNVCTFGADQIDPKDPNVERKKESFFLYFYLTINLGAFVAFSFLATVATNGLPPYIAQKDGFLFAYCFAACAMALALAIYLGGTSLYRKDSFEANTGPPVLGLFVNRLLSGRQSARGKIAICGWCLIPVLIGVAIVNAFVATWAMTLGCLAVTTLCIGCLCIAHHDNSWLGCDDVTKCLDCVPVLLIGNVAFNVLYNTMSSVFYSQACQMDTRLGSRTDATQLNGAFFNLADCLAIVAFTPLVDGLLMPGIERIIGRKVDVNMKVYAGIAMAITSQMVAASFEINRRNSKTLGIGSKCAPLLPSGEHVHMSDMNAFWMCIPYAMIGLGEILVNPVLLFYAYDRAPANMRSLVQAFNMFAMGGMPNAISSALSQAMATLTPNDLNEGDLAKVYHINMGIGLVLCFLFYLVSSGKGDCRESKKGDEQTELLTTNQTTTTYAST